MDRGVLIGAIVVALAFAGLAYASPGVMKAWQNQGGMPLWNASDAGHPHWNASLAERPRGNMSSAEMEEFWQAVAEGDYAAAKQLHEEYGFGGLLFGRLNETTFAEYSQLFSTRRKLMEELETGHGEQGMFMEGGMRLQMNGTGGGCGMQRMDETGWVKQPRHPGKRMAGINATSEDSE